MTTEFSYHYLPYCVAVFFLFYSMFLLLVHGEFEQEEHGYIWKYILQQYPGRNLGH
jgi:hypothetical protein